MSESPVNHHHAGIDSSQKKPQRSGRKPLSCLACRRHKLKCDREVPCGTCIRYRREAQCRQNPAPPKLRGRAKGAVWDTDIDAGSELADVDLAESEAIDEPLEVPARDPIVAGSTDVGLVRLRNSFRAPGADIKDTAFFLRALGLDANTTSIPVSSLSQLLAEIQTAGQPSILWHMMEGATRRRYWENAAAVCPALTVHVRPTAQLLP